MAGPAPEASAKGGPWLLGLSWLVTGGALVWLYAPHVAYMMQNWWDDPNYSHGFLIPLVCAGLVWRQRAGLKRVAAGPQPWGLLVIALGLLVLLAGLLGREFFLKRISLIPVTWGLVMLYWGWPVARRVAFAFAYLALMVPLPYVVYDSLAFPMRLLAADMAGQSLRLLGLPVLVEGNVIHLPSVVLNVVDACSGIRSLISLLAAGAVMAYVWLPNRWSKVVVVLLVLPITLVANALRVVVAGYLAETSGDWILQGAMHDMVGWLVFMVAFAGLAGVTWLLNRMLTPKEAAQ